MISVHGGGSPPHAQTSETDSDTDAARLAAGIARTRRQAQQGRFYREARFAAKEEIASSMHHTLKHNHPLTKLKHRRRKPLVLHRPVRRNVPTETKTARTEHGPHRRHERVGKDGRHQGGGQGQGEGHEQEGQQGRQRERERQDDRAPAIVKVRRAKRIDPAATSNGVLAAVETPGLPPAQLELDMRRALAARVLDIARQLPGDAKARATPRWLGLSLDLNAALQSLHKRGIKPNPTGLAGVKQLLLEVQDSAPRTAAPQPADDRGRTVNLLAPLMVLGAERPSTPRQLALAANRLRSGLAAVSIESEHDDVRPQTKTPESSQNP
ncbi:MAG TPA: hypothetical protein VF446_11490 [Trinickia sp.]